MSIRLASSSAVSRGLPKAYGTTIILQHNGLPKTPYYAIRHLRGIYENLGVPSLISGSLASLRYRYSTRIQNSLRGSGEYLPLEESHRRFANELAKKLQTVLPEFAPFTVETAYLYDSPTLQDAFEDILNRGTDRLINISLYPFGVSYIRGPMEKTINTSIKHLTLEIPNLKSGKRLFVVKNRPISFELERIDNLGSHVSFAQYWSERLSKELGDADVVIFAVPTPSPSNWSQYQEEVRRAAKRIMYTLYTRISRTVPYRIALYPSWNHSLPIYPVTTSIPHQIKSLAKFERHNPLIVPFGSLFKDFDTEYILPEIAQNVRILQPHERDSNLVHSLVELLKTSILTLKYQAEKAPLDPIF